MQSGILKKIADDIKVSKDDKGEEKVVFGKKGYNSFVIDKKNFRKINEIKDSRKIAFIDGGNSEIIGTTNFSVQLIRIYGCVFQGNKKINEIKNEFFILIDSFIENNDVVYKIKAYPVKGGLCLEKFSINSMDPGIVEGGKRAKISKVGEIVRKIGEIKLAEEIIESGKAEIIIFDGTLESSGDEKAFLEKVYENALIKEIIICALAKTTNLFTNKGKNALAYISKLGGKGVWLWGSLVEIDSEEHKADISVVKMNENSSHVFRFEIFKEQKEQKNLVLGYLVGNCRDIGFPGYPHGLILTDRYARVSNKEKGYLRSLFFSKAGRRTKDFLDELSTNNAHELLDSLN